MFKTVTILTSDSLRWEKQFEGSKLDFVRLLMSARALDVATIGFSKEEITEESWCILTQNITGFRIEEDV